MLSVAVNVISCQCIGNSQALDQLPFTPLLYTCLCTVCVLCHALSSLPIPWLLSPSSVATLLPLELSPIVCYSYPIL